MLTGTGLCSYESSAHFPPCPLLQLYIRISGKKKKGIKKKKNLGQVVHPLPWGPIPARQTAASFSPLFPPPQCAAPVSSVVMKFLRVQSWRTARAVCRHASPCNETASTRKGGLKTFSRAAGDSFLACCGSWVFGRDLAYRMPEIKVKGINSALCCLLQFLQ